jgi:replicative DNA helicase
MIEETAFISCLLNRPDLLPLVSNKIKPEFFKTKLCGEIYARLAEGTTSIPVIANDIGVSPMELINMQQMMQMITKQAIQGYAYYIFEEHKKSEIQKLLQEKVIDIDSIQQIQKETFFDEVKKDESEEYLKNVEEVYSHKPDSRSIMTGFKCIDSMIKGFRNSEAIFVGGRPGSGKTCWGINLGYNVAKSGKKVLFCSLEMGATELHERLVKHITQISDYWNMSNEDFDKIVETSKYVKTLPFIIYDKPGMTIEDIVYQCKETEGIDMVIIDHLAILKTTKYFSKKYEIVSYLSNRIKQLARELDKPVVCLCQLNRALESRDLKAPTMADIRDSGSVEEDGDLVCFIYRPEYHLKDKEPDDKSSREYYEWQESMDKVKGKAQFIVAKNRRGMIGRCNLGFIANTFTFYDRGE